MTHSQLDTVAQQILNPVWPERGSALLPYFKRLNRIDGGRHGHHTHRVVQIMDALLAGPEQPGWPAAVPPHIWRDELAAGLPSANLLRAAALLHDIGKTESLSRHDERSYRLLVRHVPPTSDSIIWVALLIRYHASLGNLQTGEAAPLALLPLITDVRQHALNPQPFLTGLLLLTLADWAAYELLSPGVVSFLVETTRQLQRPLWWAASPPEVTAALWAQSAAETADRLRHLLLFAYRTPTPVTDAQLQLIGGADWADFQRRFTQVWFDGGYSVFDRCLSLAGSAAAHIEALAPHLRRWLPPQPDSGLTRIDLRPLAADLPHQPLAEILRRLAGITGASDLQ